MNELSNVEKQAILRNRLKFMEMAKAINSYLKEEGLCLNFKGYTETIREYLSMINTDIELLSTLSYDLNLWANYFGELEGFIEMKMLKLENKYLYLECFFNKKQTNIELEKQLNETKMKYKHFKLFLKHIINQKKMFEKAYKHCLWEYDKSLNNLLYKYND